MIPLPIPDKLRKVGDRIRVSMQMHGGKIADATIKAVIETISDPQYRIRERPDGDGH